MDQDSPMDLSCKAGPNPIAPTHADNPPLGHNNQQTGPGQSPYISMVIPPNGSYRRTLLPTPQPLADGTTLYGPTRARPQQPIYGHRYHGATRNYKQAANGTRQWRSSNTDFGRLIFLLVNYLSIKHHLRNWASMPNTIGVNIRKLLEAIHLPGADRHPFQALEVEWKDSLTKAAQNQLV